MLYIYKSLEQTTGYWVGQNKYNWVRGVCKHGDGCIRERLQKIAAQVYIDVYNGSMMISVY